MGKNDTEDGVRKTQGSSLPLPGSRDDSRLMSHEEENSVFTQAQRLVFTNSHFTYGNVEAWVSIIRSYLAIHPVHRVTMFYDGQPIHNLLSLYKRIGSLNTDLFEVRVATPDNDQADIAKLVRLLADGASPDYLRYIQKELHRVLELF